MKISTKIILTIILVPLALCVGMFTAVFEQTIHILDFIKQEVWSL